MMKIIKIVNLIDHLEWYKARTIWILKVLCLKPENNSFSLFGGETLIFEDKFRNQHTVCYVCTGCGKSYRPKLDFQIRKEKI